MEHAIMRCSDGKWPVELAGAVTGAPNDLGQPRRQDARLCL